MPIFPTGYTQKSTPADDDQVLIGDSAASNAIKKTKISAIIAKAVSAVQAATNWITTAMITAGAVTAEKLASGVPVQEVSTAYSNVATGTTTIPFDDTSPQITEGVEFMTQTITPTSPTNTLIIEVEMMLSISANGQRMCALFQGSQPNALAAKSTYVGSYPDPVVLTMRHKMTAGTTSPITFRVRGGSEIAGTWTFNGSGGGRRFGTTSKSSIKVTEVKA